MQNKIDIVFADGLYTFALPLARINELERKVAAGTGTPAGIGSIFARVLKGCARVGDDMVQAPALAEFYAIDLIETIRQGLIGGNHGVVNEQDITVSPALADRLITSYVMERPLTESWATAASVLATCIVGYEPPADKKKAEPPAKTKATAKAG